MISTDNFKFIVYPDGDFSNWPENFHKELNEIEKCCCGISLPVYIYAVKNYLAYFPNAENRKVYFKNKNGNNVAENSKLSSIIDKIRQFDDKWQISKFKQENIKLCVFIGYSGRDEIERILFHKTEEESSQSSLLNITPVEPSYSFSKMVLNGETREALASCAALIRNLIKIYDEWGFSEIDPVRKSVINFYGPPGTGKTMAAHGLAAELGLKILPVNYAEIESKYVGDAPKNLMAAFEIAKKENSVLFFDEADSFLGKRITNVSSSSDQSVNSLRSQMLILLEKFDIVVIFATNLNENYDKAFNSRIIRSVKFDLPDKELRKNAIPALIPSRAPIDRNILDDELLDKLCDLSEGFSYRELKNTILLLLTECCAKNIETIDKELLLDVFEKKKKEVESLKEASKSRKEKLGAQITENLKTGNYTVQNCDNDKQEEKKNE